jgi:hypothetical protein
VLSMLLRPLLVVEGAVYREAKQEQRYRRSDEQRPEDAPPGPARKEQPLQPHEIQ